MPAMPVCCSGFPPASGAEKQLTLGHAFKDLCAASLSVDVSGSDACPSLKSVGKVEEGAQTRRVLSSEPLVGVFVYLGPLRTF